MVHYRASNNNLSSVYPLNRQLSVAPMMGCTDRHCRFLLRQISPSALLYTEMVVTGALLHGRAPHFLQHEGDAPCALQLGGSDPDALARCAVMAAEAGYQEVNLNVGCPSDKVQYGGIGACLMAEPALVAECLSRMQAEVDIPVTVKSRIGINDRDDYTDFHHFVATLYERGCRVFIVHARKAILGGLSPKENREIPPLRYEFVYRIRDEFPGATFILNGGLKTVRDVTEAMTKVDGVMLGRAPYSDPWLLADIDSTLFGTVPADRLTVLATYRDYVEQQVAKGEHFKHMARHLLGFFTACSGARAFRRHLSERMFDPSATARVIDEALDKSGLGNAGPTTLKHRGQESYA